MMTFEYRKMWDKKVRKKKGKERKMEDTAKRGSEKKKRWIRGKKLGQKERGIKVGHGETRIRKEIKMK